MRNIKTREGFEFWDKLNALPRYAFLLSPSGKSVQKFEDQAMGNWIDVHEAQKIVDEAEERINERQDELREVSHQLEQFRERCHGIKNLSAIESRDDQLAVSQLKINELQQRLNAADQRIDELTQERESLIAYGRNNGLHEASTVCSRMAYDTYYPAGSRFKYFVPKALEQQGNLLIKAANAIAALPDGPIERHRARQQKKAEKSASA